jgi:hypothetical protein
MHPYWSIDDAIVHEMASLKLPASGMPLESVIKDLK